jgi:hypothetical protein
MSVLNKDGQSSQGGGAGVKSPTTTDTDDTKSRIGDEYILVRKGTGIDEKGLSKPTLVNYRSLLQQQRVPDTKAAPVGALITDSEDSLYRNVTTPSSLGAVKSTTQRSGLKKLGNMRCSLNYSAVVANTSAGTNSTSLVVAPTNSAEFSSISSLYDEVKVHRFRCRYSDTSLTALTATAGGNGGTGVLSVDFVRNVAITTFSDAFDRSAFYPYDAAVSVASSGVVKLGGKVDTGWIKVPTGTQTTSNPSGKALQFVGSAWCSVNDTGAGTVAAINWFAINSQVNSATVGLSQIWMDCEFRCRD